ncbi:MAG: hypothetical protein KGL35_07850 [Bradyrhizobium sp.]|uniref:hypothetical protein n=1 Tax=Bradyrhizobium sp. TaxID=376 RepID=UPI001C2953A1|nr:hypothetical protein [Bradyrhizobium sp.]MBU6465026.1 hypothetical protein [Pseudomonadota bacterium]MDE2066955.1 hypothetical protein [Bradyrhizobium sp.]MDE2468642.1 hypothetical protein [Bradyrhizobium sp.]
MKVLSMYPELQALMQLIERAFTFERLASEEPGAELKRAFSEQARAYRDLAAGRASKIGIDACRSAIRDDVAGLRNETPSNLREDPSGFVS